jgi:hypothetical protein
MFNLSARGNLDPKPYPSAERASTGDLNSGMQNYTGFKNNHILLLFFISPPPLSYKRNAIALLHTSEFVGKIIQMYGYIHFTS